MSLVPVSFEFFPPKSDQGRMELSRERAKLAQLRPRYFSVTCGAGGSTRGHTFDTVCETIDTTSIEAVPHMTCLGENREHIMKLLLNYKRNGVKRIVALRGDVPVDGRNTEREFRYARDLVAFIREFTGDYFQLEVAAYPEMHPQSSHIGDDFTYFLEKIRAGANGAITQYFYNVDAYEHFLNLCVKHNVGVPIVPGIMPITNYVRLMKFSEMCGAQVPRWLEQKLRAFEDDTASIQAFGIDFVSGLCERLIDLGAPGLHFYTLNQSKASMHICSNLGIVKVKMQPDVLDVADLI